MSAHIERPHRRGVALLIAIAIGAVVGVCVLALWRESASATRAVTLESAIERADALADSALVRATAIVDSGGWTRLSRPGETVLFASASTRATRWRAESGRVAWGTLVIRGVAEVRSGVRGVWARSERRSIVPLRAPLPMPEAAVTGVQPWIVAAGATLDVPPAVGAEVVCRGPAGATASARHPYPVAIDSVRLPLVDADTVRDSLVGAFRLIRGRIARPLRITGMVVVDTEVVVDADLRVTGVLVARGSVHAGGGRLDVIGAVVSGDSGGGPSGLGSGDRVRYDACAIRRAVARVTSPGPTSTWTTLRVF
jgi:hypothetical protein